MSFIAAGVSLTATIASTGAMMYGQKKQADAQEQAAAYNDELAKAEARNLELETHEGIKRERMNQRSAMAAMRNRMASAGTVSDSGTPLKITGETAGRMEIAIADAVRASAMKAASMRAKGKMGLWEADQYSSAAKLSMIGTGLAGVTKAAGQYQDAKYLGSLP